MKNTTSRSERNCWVKTVFMQLPIQNGQKYAGSYRGLRWGRVLEGERMSKTLQKNWIARWTVPSEPSQNNELQDQDGRRENRKGLRMGFCHSTGWQTQKTTGGGWVAKHLHRSQELSEVQSLSASRAGPLGGARAQALWWEQPLQVQLQEIFKATNNNKNTLFLYCERQDKR